MEVMEEEVLVAVVAARDTSSFTGLITRIIDEDCRRSIITKIVKPTTIHVQILMEMDDDLVLAAAAAALPPVFFL
jgi:hypothetical protein